MKYFYLIFALMVLIIGCGGSADNVDEGTDSGTAPSREGTNSGGTDSGAPSTDVPAIGDMTTSDPEVLGTDDIDSLDTDLDILDKW